MSMWEIAAYVDGFNRANSTEDAPPDAMSASEHDDLMARHFARINRKKD